MTTWPSRDRFDVLAARHRVVPVARQLPLGELTPLQVHQALTGDRTGTFLLESGGEAESRWSFVGVTCPSALTVLNGSATWLGRPVAGVGSSDCPVDVLRSALRVLRSCRLPGGPPLTGGFVGYLGYDVVRRWENLPDRTVDDLGLPEVHLSLVTNLAAIDHRERVVVLIANAVSWTGTWPRNAYDDAVRRLDDMAAMLGDAEPDEPFTFDKPAPEPVRHCAPSSFEDLVAHTRDRIRAGEAEQVVVSQRFSMPTKASALDVYRVLRQVSPSAYMYRLRPPGFEVVGVSPESLATVRNGVVATYPIAGTRRRGRTPDEDVAIERELRGDPKERAEHQMLVDLGRDDLGRVCRPGSVRADRLFEVERYSNVMHLCSTLSGELTPGKDAVDAIAACFPAGTMTGAPRVRAMELIEEAELTRRGLYGGAVGYFGFTGDADTAIAIRTAVIRDGIAHVQAGAGVIACSDPAAENAECGHKASAVLGAIAAAETIRRSAPTT